MTKTYHNTLLPLALVALLSAVWPRCQAYRLYREVDAKAKLCRKNISNVGIACQIYQDERKEFPTRVSDVVPEYLQTEPQCPFDGSPYQAEEILITTENEDRFPQGLIETGPGEMGVKVCCTSPLHQRFQPDLQPGYGSRAGFRQRVSQVVIDR